MEQLEKASDVVCLMTPRSVDRPWILYEAGVAKGRLDTRVHGIALGISLSRASTGPFAQFENCDDDDESLTKLVMQLLECVPGSEPSRDAVLAQVHGFKQAVKESIAKLGQAEEGEQEQSVDVSGIAKMFEEVKVMFRGFSSRVESIVANSDRPIRQERLLQFHPELVNELVHVIGGKSQDLGLLFLASLFRDDFPWLYELGVEAYRAFGRGDVKRGARAVAALKRAAEFTARGGPLGEKFGPRGREAQMLRTELPLLVDHFARHANLLMEHEQEDETQEKPG